MSDFLFSLTLLENFPLSSPEIFPEVMEKGYKLQGLVNSKRQKLTTRRIKLKSNKEAYQISTL
jgi:hypothetical protein